MSHTFEISNESTLDGEVTIADLRGPDGALVDRYVGPPWAANAEAGYAALAWTWLAETHGMKLVTPSNSGWTGTGHLFKVAPIRG